MPGEYIDKGRYCEKLAAYSYYFVAPALFYGVFTSRLPDIKTLLSADDSSIGGVLLSLGLGTVIGLFAATYLVDRLGSRRVLPVATSVMALGIVLACLALNIPQMMACLALCGLGVGFCDVAMNAQGIALERSQGRLCLAFLHACSGIGGALGALSGSVCAFFHISPFINMLLIAVPFMIAVPWTKRRMVQDLESERGTSRQWLCIVPIVWLCGFMSLICHVAEGSVGEWGSLLLHTVKGASTQLAGLVFAVFTVSLVLCRLFVDRLRLRMRDSLIIASGALVSACGMSLVLLSPLPVLCLAGYALMGLGIAPISPILFSIAGRSRGITTGQASGIVSIFSYAGLLLLPPLLGALAQTYGLSKSLWLVVLLCSLLGFGAVGLRSDK